MALGAGLRAVVTGAGSGLGRAFCEELASRGASIVGADVNEAGLRETGARLGGARWETFLGDVSRRSTVEDLHRVALERLGGVDLVINNAGVAVAGELGSVSEADWGFIVGVNLLGVAHGCEVFVPTMRAQRSGHVLNVASLAGLVSSPGMGPYNATKAAVVALSETLYGELRGTGVGVTVLCPSFFPTNIARDGRGSDERMKALAESLMKRSPITARDVARIALDGAAKGRLYVLPHREGKVLWWLKRGAPKAFYDGTAAALARVRKRFGA